MNIVELLQQFISMVGSKEVEVYNEFSLQHELGIFLRDNLKEYKVQFERNTKFFGITGTVKHEIDIVIYKGDEKYAIELKYPLRGQYPEQMFSFIKDICFMEELKQAGFNGTYCLTLVEDKNFYDGKKRDEIYSFFRGKACLHGEVQKPTGKRDEQLFVSGNYVIKWSDCGHMKYYIMETT